MSSDSDSEDDVQTKRFLEAADTYLLNNAMFQKQDETISKTEISAALRNPVKEIGSGK